MNIPLDVIIIGGGISGLSASKLLTEQGVSSVVLEARDRVGGRTWTVHDPSYGGYTDIGGAYIGPTQRRVARMINELGLKLYKIYATGKNVLLIQGSRMVYNGNFPTLLNPIVMLDLNNALQAIDKMASEIPPAAPWTAPKAIEWDKMTMQQCIDSICWTKFARDFLRVCYYHSLAMSPNDVSMLYGLWYTINCQGLGRMIYTTDGGQERKFIGGSQQLSTKMAEKLGDRVHLNEPVIRVEQSADGVRVITATGTEYNAKYVISAMPQAILNRVTFVPALLPDKLQLIQRMPMGQACKTMVFYNRPYWRELGFSGETAGDTFPHSQTLDDTKPDGTAPCLIGFVVGDNCVKFMRLPPEDRRRIVAQYYADAFKCEELLRPINYVDKTWSDEEYSGGCYVSALPPGTLTNFGHAIRTPYHRLYFAGTESGSYWSGYMEGAIQAGERAAREVLHAMGRIHANDIIVDEPYHPELPEPPINYSLVQRSLPSVPTFALSTAGIAAILASELKSGAVSGFIRSIVAKL